MTIANLITALPDADATHRLGILLGELLPAGSTVLLEGDLGSGKTTLVQGIGYGLGLREPILSPTFTLINEYPEGRIPLYHFDLYRLHSQEVDALRVDLYWEGVEVPPGIVAIEWADRLPVSPEGYLQLRLTPISDGRRVELTAVGAVAGEVLTKIGQAIAADCT